MPLKSTDRFVATHGRNRSGFLIFVQKWWSCHNCQTISIAVTIARHKRFVKVITGRKLMFYGTIFVTKSLNAASKTVTALALLIPRPVSRCILFGLARLPSYRAGHLESR